MSSDRPLSSSSQPRHMNPSRADYEQIDQTTYDSNTPVSEPSLQPQFLYHASLHSLDTASPQAHPAIASSNPTTPLSAALRLRTDVDDSRRTVATAFPPADIEVPLYQVSSSAGLPLRSGSVRSTLSAAARGRTGSLSPHSTLSSPGIGPLVDMTPLPSPMSTAFESAGLWGAMLDGVNTSAAQAMVIPEDDNTTDESIPFARSSPKKHRIPLCIDAEVLKINAASHSRNRSLSEYVPEGIPVPRTRNVAVSGTVAPMSATPLSPEQPMHREEYLAVQRGLTLPVIQPPTPPRSDHATPSDVNELIDRSLSPPVQPQPSAFEYEAHVIRTGELQRWRAVRQLGKGTFSTVMLATSQNTGVALFGGQSSTDESQLDPKSLVAVKICEQGPAGGADEQKVELSLKRELEILRAIHHPSLVHLKAVSIQDRRALLVLNYCPGGDLFELASLKLDLLVPSLIQRIFAELVAAVRCLHEQYIVHRDIKLENVLVNLPASTLPTIVDWQTYPYPVVTLTDLGLGRWIPKPPESPLLDTRCGSEDYAAPEVLMGQEYDGRHTDAWALGVLLYAIMEGRLPFDPIPGSRKKSPTSHRIARCEWSWVRWADADGEFDAARGHALLGGCKVVEGLLLRNSRRWDLEKVGSTEWVGQGVTVDGGLRRFGDDD